MSLDSRPRPRLAVRRGKWRLAFAMSHRRPTKLAPARSECIWSSAKGDDGLLCWDPATSASACDRQLAATALTFERVKSSIGRVLAPSTTAKRRLGIHRGHHGPAARPPLPYFLLCDANELRIQLWITRPTARGQHRSSDLFGVPPEVLNFMCCQPLSRREDPRLWDLACKRETRVVAAAHLHLANQLGVA